MKSNLYAANKKLLEAEPLKKKCLRCMLLEASPARTGNIPIHLAQEVFKKWIDEIALGGFDELTLVKEIC